MDARNMQRREINKYIKHNCAPSWTYLLGGHLVIGNIEDNKSDLNH
jgi:hypothetical protein